nr:hypothetical protein [Nesterenkonia sp. PF2B19]
MHGDGGGVLVDVRGTGLGHVVLQDDEPGGHQHVDASSLVDLVIGDGHGVPVLEVLHRVIRLGVQGQWDDLRAADHGEIVIVVDVVVGQVGDVLEPVGVEVSVAQCRVGDVVVVEVDDLHVIAEFLGGDVGQELVGLVLGGHTDAEGLVVGCVVTSAEDGAAGGRQGDGEAQRGQREGGPTGAADGGADRCGERDHERVLLR